MKVDVFFSPAGVGEPEAEGKTAVVIDVIRATSCMVEGIANGARGIFPTVEPENAVKLASDLGREDTLLCGERKGLRIEGFDLGNSPAEFSSEVVKGKQLVMSTTNGTRAFLAVEDAERVLAVSFLNLSAAAETLRGVEALVVVCAGKENRFSMDDALCAGVLLQKLLADGPESLEMNDATRIVLDMAEKYQPGESFLRSSAAGQALVDVGLEGDLALCAALDRHAMVPEMKERRIGLPKPKTG
ncbi:MAG: 2-phosphosulfolactate phosphatase [Gemmatimonadota bacterium]